jgi:hypothetical protein
MGSVLFGSGKGSVASELVIRQRVWRAAGSGKSKMMARRQGCALRVRQRVR